MQLFGYALPFIGFRELPITWDHEIALNDNDEFYYTGFSASCLTAMWFGWGVVLYRGTIRRDNDDASVV